MTLPEPVAFGIFWAALAVSLLFSVFAAYDSWKEYRDVRWTYQRAKELFTNGRLRIARARSVGGFWYLVGFNMMAAVFILVTYRAFTEPPDPDSTLILSVLTRIFAVFVVLAFWRTMRGQRRIRAELDESEDAALGMRKVQAMQERTYEEVIKQGEQIDEMQQRGQSDRPAEQADREEGQEHRRGS